MKIFSTILVLIILCTCGVPYTRSVIFENAKYKLIYSVKDRGKFVNNFYELYQKSSAKSVKIETSESSLFADDNFLYYYKFGTPNTNYFLNIKNDSAEVIFDRFEANRSKFSFRNNLSSLSTDSIYILKSNLLIPFQKIENIKSFYELGSGYYYIPYPGILYEKKKSYSEYFQ